jgi:hypothetical protein
LLLRKEKRTAKSKNPRQLDKVIRGFYFGFYACVRSHEVKINPPSPNVKSATVIGGFFMRPELTPT